MVRPEPLRTLPVTEYVRLLFFVIKQSDVHDERSNERYLLFIEPVPITLLLYLIWKLPKSASLAVPALFKTTRLTWKSFVATVTFKLASSTSVLPNSLVEALSVVPSAKVTVPTEMFWLTVTG
jgi:hypothetical protein